MRSIIILTIFLFVMEICMAKKEVNFLRLANCPEYKNATLVYKNLVLKKNKQGKSVSIRFDWVIKKEIKRLMVVLTLMKCDNSENLDGCEIFLKDFKVKNACDVMGIDNQPWTSAVSNSNFPKSCPIPVGTYTLNETKIDSDMQLTLMPVPIALWKMRFFAYDSGNDNAMICCTNMYVQVYNTRKH